MLQNLQIVTKSIVAAVYDRQYSTDSAKNRRSQSAATIVDFARFAAHFNPSLFPFLGARFSVKLQTHKNRGGSYETPGRKTLVWHRFYGDRHRSASIPNI